MGDVWLMLCRWDRWSTMMVIWLQSWWGWIRSSLLHLIQTALDNPCLRDDGAHQRQVCVCWTSHCLHMPPLSNSCATSGIHSLLLSSPLPSIPLVTCCEVSSLGMFCLIYNPTDVWSCIEMQVNILPFIQSKRVKNHLFAKQTRTNWSQSSCSDPFNVWMYRISCCCLYRSSLMVGCQINRR